MLTSKTVWHESKSVVTMLIAVLRQMIVLLKWRKVFIQNFKKSKAKLYRGFIVPTKFTSVNFSSILSDIKLHGISAIPINVGPHV